MNAHALLAPSWRADFVILDGDPRPLPSDEWAEGLMVRATFVGG